MFHMKHSRRELLKGVAAALTLPALPFTIANALPAPGAVAEPCPEFPFFGAGYPDATCIEGYLWDLDSCDGPDRLLHSGGDIPCPYCNAAEFLDYYRERLDEMGYLAFCDGESPADNPYLKGCRFPHLAVAMAELWREGYRTAAIDPEAITERAHRKSGHGA